MKKEDFIKLGFNEEDAEKASDATIQELKSYIPKKRFDEVNTERENLRNALAEKDKELESINDVETLKVELEALQNENKTKEENHLSGLRKLKRDFLDHSVLSESKAKNSKAVKALLEDIDDSVDEETYKSMRTNQVKNLVESSDTRFLFDTETDMKMRGVTMGNVINRSVESKGDISKMTYESFMDI